MKKLYIPRLFDGILEFALKSKGAVVVAGPKWCGKSRTCERLAKTDINLLPLEKREQYVSLARSAPSLFLSQGPKPILIDEWQIVSFIWDSLKTAVDESDSFGRYILTGSVTDKSSLDDDDGHHTGNGRIVTKRMRTMSLFESGESTGEVSLSSLRGGSFKPSVSKLGIADYAFLICRGGWPLSVNEEEEVALEQAIDYTDILAEKDIFSLRDAPLQKNEQRARKLLRSYSRMVGSEAPDLQIKKDMASNDASLDDETLSKYLLALKRLYVIDELEAWNPNLRSKTAIRSKNTRQFVDPSIATASLGLSPQSLFRDMKTFGLLFESLAIRDLRIYAETLGAKVYHYRDKAGREADAVIVFRDGDFAIIEIKLGDETDIDKGAKELLALSSDADESEGKPALMMVVTKGKFALHREDGVYVVPLGCLRN